MKTLQSSKINTGAISIKVDPEVKNLLGQRAEKRGMDLSKLTRAILTNWVKPDSYQI